MIVWNNSSERSFHQPGDVHPLYGWCWAIVCDTGPTSNKQYPVGEPLVFAMGLSDVRRITFICGLVILVL